MGKTKHLKIISDWVVSNENEYSISTMTSRFMFKSRFSWIESLKFESNQYQIARYLNRIAQCLNRIFVAIQIAIESNRDLISPITGYQLHVTLGVFGVGPRCRTWPPAPPGHRFWPGLLGLGLGLETSGLGLGLGLEAKFSGLWPWPWGFWPRPWPCVSSLGLVQRIRLELSAVRLRF